MSGRHVTGSRPVWACLPSLPAVIRLGVIVIVTGVVVILGFGLDAAVNVIVATAAIVEVACLSLAPDQPAHRPRRWWTRLA